MAAPVKLKKIPYGEADFSVIRNEDYAFVDNTRFIEVLEDCGSRFPFIIRPRRFGKSLVTSMMMKYYDKASAADFDRYFHGTYIGSHKTPSANQFYVLKLDFSAIDPSEGLEQGFTGSLRERIAQFFERYPLRGYENFLSQNRDTVSPAALFRNFVEFARSTTKFNLYVIIDEYDQFANEILASDPAMFRRITSVNGFLKNFYAQLKRCAVEDGVIARVFITGVTSISLDSMTSGFSVSEDFTHDPAFSDLYGFTEAELRTLIPQVLDLDRLGLTEDFLVQRLKDWYNGYRFCPDVENTVFNSSMCLYYLKVWERRSREPERLLDPSVAGDLSKIQGILSLGTPEDVEAIVTQAIAHNPIPFRAEPEHLNLQQNGRLSKDGLLTTLLCMGYLTYAPGNRCELIISNRAMAQQFFDIYFQVLRNVPDWKSSRYAYDKAVTALNNGDPLSLLLSIADNLKASCGIHKNLHLRESDFQTALLVAANFAPQFKCAVEVEVTGGGNGFADVLLQAKDSGPSYLFELKYLSKTKSEGNAVSNQLDDAVRQLRNYVRGDNIRTIANLQCVAAVFSGLELAAAVVSDTNFDHMTRYPQSVS